MQLTEYVKLIVFFSFSVSRYCDINGWTLFYVEFTQECCDAVNCFMLRLRMEAMMRAIMRTIMSSKFTMCLKLCCLTSRSNFKHNNIVNT